MAGQNGQKVFEFGDFQLIPDEGLLLRNGEPIPLGPKGFATLVFLVEHQGHLVQKAELMDEVWADAFVEENAVSKSVWAIRSALGEDPKVARFIQTVPKRGYRFVEEVKVLTRNTRADEMAADSNGFNAGRSVDPEAYDHYLRGRFYLNRQNQTDQDVAINLFERAVAIDPTFATAYAALAQAYTWKHFSFAPEEIELAEKAFVATERALSMDPYLAVAYLARGRLLWTPANHFPHEKAIRDYQRALELNPNLDEARNQLALVYCHVGALDEALLESYEGVKVNPTNNLLQLRIGQTLNYQTNYEEALVFLRGMPDDVHPSVVGHQIAWALVNLGRKDEASAKLQRLLRVHPDRGGSFASIQAWIAVSSGQNKYAEDLIEQAIEKGKGYGHFHHTAYTIACAYALMSRPGEAMKWLEAAAETGFPCYPLFERDANLDSLRQDRRFSRFLNKSKTQWEYFKSLAKKK